MKLRVLVLALAGLGGAAQADEGMWQPHQLPAIAKQLEAAGIEVDPKQLSELTRYPMNAIVGLGFCTASFVSPMGLVVTNHHCAYGTIQFNSTAEKNLLKDGFLAQTLGEEKRGEPTLRVFVTESITEVTDSIRKDLDQTTDGRARFDAIDQRQKQLVADCEAGGGYRCDVYVFNGGSQYFLIKQMEIRDVRLVYAPAEAIGKFGGDIDNWMWPRHTGDFAYYRAYVGPDGKPADFSENNVPYRPKSYLKVEAEGVDAGDFVMVAGYPGRTNRYRLAEEVRDAIEWSYPSLIARYRKLLALIDEHTKERPDAAVKYAASVASFNNGLKNFEGNLDGFKRIDAVGIKQAEEARILAWAKANPEKAPQSAAGYEAVRRNLAEQRSRRDRDQIMQLLAGTGLNAAARDLYRINVEREKPDAEREFGFQQRDEVRIEGRLRQLDRRWDPVVDRALVEYLMQSYLELPAEQRIAELDRWIAGGDAQPDAAALKARLDALYAGTELGNADKRMAWFKAGRAAIEASKDPALQFAVAMLPAQLRIENQVKTYNGLDSLYRPQWLAARMAEAKSQGREVYPDANNSLRVTFGNVVGYSPKDGVDYRPFTYLEGIVEKHTGVDPFDATERQLSAIREQRFGSYAVDGKVPVNFLSNLDITGGNSGSPILNGRGELIGLAFDGNYEAISSGWLFNNEVTRCIGVDVRYMLWVMDAVDNAHHLLEEMGVKPQFER